MSEQDSPQKPIRLSVFRPLVQRRRSSRLIARKSDLAGRVQRQYQPLTLHRPRTLDEPAAAWQEAPFVWVGSTPAVPAATPAGETPPMPVVPGRTRPAGRPTVSRQAEPSAAPPAPRRAPLTRTARPKPAAPPVQRQANSTSPPAVPAAPTQEPESPEPAAHVDREVERNDDLWQRMFPTRPSFLESVRSQETRRQQEAAARRPPPPAIPDQLPRTRTWEVKPGAGAPVARTAAPEFSAETLAEDSTADGESEESGSASRAGPPPTPLPRRPRPVQRAAVPDAPAPPEDSGEQQAATPEPGPPAETPKTIIQDAATEPGAFSSDADAAPSTAVQRSSEKSSPPALVQRSESDQTAQHEDKEPAATAKQETSGTDGGGESIKAAPPPKPVQRQTASEAPETAPAVQPTTEAEKPIQAKTETKPETLVAEAAAVARRPDKPEAPEHDAQPAALPIQEAKPTLPPRVEPTRKTTPVARVAEQPEPDDDGTIVEITADTKTESPALSAQVGQKPTATPETPIRRVTVQPQAEAPAAQDLPSASESPLGIPLVQRSTQEQESLEQISAELQGPMEPAAQQEPQHPRVSVTPPAAKSVSQAAAAAPASVQRETAPESQTPAKLPGSTGSQASGAVQAETKAEPPAGAISSSPPEPTTLPAAGPTAPVNRQAETVVDQKPQADSPEPAGPVQRQVESAAPPAAEETVVAPPEPPLDHSVKPTAPRSMPAAESPAALKPAAKAPPRVQVPAAAATVPSTQPAAPLARQVTRPAPTAAPPTQLPDLPAGEVTSTPVVAPTPAVSRSVAAMPLVTLSPRSGEAPRQTPVATSETTAGRVALAPAPAPRSAEPLPLHVPPAPIARAVETRQLSSPRPESRPRTSESAADETATENGQEAEPNLDQLAREVYEIIHRRLTVERERYRGL